MPTLNWIGKDTVINHHKQVPFRLLNCNDKLSVGDDDLGIELKVDLLYTSCNPNPYANLRPSSFCHVTSSWCKPVCGAAKAGVLISQ